MSPFTVIALVGAVSAAILGLGLTVVLALVMAVAVEALLAYDRGSGRGLGS